MEEGQAQYVLTEIHEEICGNHFRVWLLAHKALRQGYYWPTIQENVKKMVRSCDQCQRFIKVTHMPIEKLTIMTGRVQTKYAIVTKDYYTKSVEIEFFSTITKRKTNQVYLEVPNLTSLMEAVVHFGTICADSVSSAPISLF